jgi:fucose permease
MSWLHAFWGIGATSGPLLMAWMIGVSSHWQNGYRLVSFIQFFLVSLLAITLPLWKKSEPIQKSDSQESRSQTPLFQIPGILPNLLAFFSYCALELSAGLWFASYLVQIRNVTPQTASGWAASYYLGIMLGRLINGFLTARFSSKTLIRAGQASILMGILLLFLPGQIISLIALLLVGLGCAPIYPSMLHETPVRFGQENSSRLMGIQMASAYLGLTLMPPLLGLLATYTSLTIFPFALLVLLLLMFSTSERVNQIVENRKQNDHPA